MSASTSISKADFQASLARLGFMLVKGPSPRMVERADLRVRVDMALTRKGHVDRATSLARLNSFIAVRRDMRRQAAHLADRRRATAERIAPSALVPPRAGLDGDGAIAQLADDMRLAGQREGGVSRDDLKTMGWTAAQLDTLGDRARQQAQQLAGGAL